MITNVYYASLAFACLFAWANWRRAIYLAVILDFLRDPVRKLDSDESVRITVSILAVWGVIAFAAWSQSQREIRRGLKVNPLLIHAFRLLLLATIPGCIVALLLYQEGYKMVALGLVSYLAPTAGVVLGLVLPKKREDITNLLKFYSIINGAALIGVVAEFQQWQIPALGGMRGMNWIRYSGDEIVDLIGGFYRSPDIMGLHAAQVVMFSLILTVNRPRRFSLLWLSLAVFASVCLLLSGRRKMLGIPLVWAASLGVLCYLRKIRLMSGILVPAMTLGAAAGGVYFLTTEKLVGDEYANYAQTLFTDGFARTRTIIGDSLQSTFLQSGLVGSGIGCATQGNYHVVKEGARNAWQEDGASRLLKELGVAGLLLLLMSLWYLCKSIWMALLRVPYDSSLPLFQLMLLCVVIANGMSFLISHQQYSGDPPSALIVLLVLGMFFAVSDFQLLDTGRSEKGRSLKRLDM